MNPAEVARLQQKVEDLEKRLRIAEQDLQLEHSGRLIAEERAAAERAEERERCAKVCEGVAVVKFTPQQGWYDQDDGRATLAAAAAAIRALPPVSR